MFQIICSILLFVATSAAYAGTPSTKTEAQARSKETQIYRLDYQVAGEPVEQTVAIYPDSPAQNKDLIAQIKAAGVDHVLFVEEAPEGATEGLAEAAVPMEAGALQQEYQRVKSSIGGQSTIESETVRMRPGFFKRFAQNWNHAFGARREARKQGLRYGLTSLVTKLGTYSIMLITAQQYGIEVAVPMMMAQGFFGFVNNAFPEEINTLMASSFKTPGATVHSRAVFVRKLLYVQMMGEIYKFAEFGSSMWTGVVQAGVLTSTILYGIGDSLISTQAYEAFKTERDRNIRKMKVSRINFWTGAFSGGFVSLDLMKHRWMPSLLQIGFMDLRVSGAILLGYYATVYLMLKTNPERLYRIYEKIENLVTGVGTRVKGWIQDCNAVFGARQR